MWVALSYLWRQPRGPGHRPDALLSNYTRFICVISAGPYTAIWYCYKHMDMSRAVTTPCPTWILALSAVGIVLGLNTYGYNMIRVLGVKMCKMSPSRGYCAELATAIVLTGSLYCGYPVSFTHCIVSSGLKVKAWACPRCLGSHSSACPFASFVLIHPAGLCIIQFGATMGIGACEGIRSGVNWRFFATTFVGWCFTLFISGLMSACFFCAGETVGGFKLVLNALLYNAVTPVPYLTDYMQIFLSSGST